MKLTNWRRLRSMTAIGAAAAIGTAGAATVIGGGVAAAKSTKSPFVIVAMQPSSGALKLFAGQAGLTTQAAAANVLNKNGGILGHKVVVTIIDTASTVSAGASKLAARLNSKPTVDAVIPGQIGTQGVAYVPLANKHKIISIGQPNETTLNTPSKYPYEFEMAGSEKLPAKQFAQYSKSKGWKNVAILASTNPYGKSVGSDMTAAFKAAGIKTEQATYNTTQLTMTPQLQQLQSAKPTALYINSEGPPLKYILQDRVKLGWTTITAIGDLSSAVSGISNALAGTPTEKNYVIHATTPSKYNPHPSAAEKQFLSALKTVGLTQVPVGLVYLGYDAVMVLAAAVQQAHAMTGPKVAKALEHLKTPSKPLWVGFTSVKYSQTTHTPTLPLSSWTVMQSSTLTAGQFDAPGATLSTGKP